MQATVEQLSRILVFVDLTPPELERLQPHTQVQRYSKGEIVMHEGDRLPATLYALLSGSLQVVKTATTGKETILRTLPAGEIFAAPALLGDGIAPATVTAECDSQILMVERDALLEAIRQSPEIALRMLMIFNSRLQQLHDTVHGLVSERAIVRLVRLIQYLTSQYGTEPSSSGRRLKAKLSYYQMARSIGITYEECVRMFKSLKSVVAYSRGGKITVLDAKELEAIASGTAQLNAANTTDPQP
jgi:CRP-like cAMP-binding protein